MFYIHSNIFELPLNNGECFEKTEKTKIEPEEGKTALRNCFLEFSNT